jgi:hypothetical protein
MFVNVYGHTLQDEYDISYLTEQDLLSGQHKLYTASNSLSYETLSHIFELMMVNQDRFCSTTVAELLQYDQNITMTDADKLEIFETMENVEDVRFIQLIVKDNLINNLDVYSRIYNLIIGVDMDVVKSDFKSRLIYIPTPNPVSILSRNIVDMLIMSSIDSLNGISIVT